MNSPDICDVPLFTPLAWDRASHDHPSAGMTTQSNLPSNTTQSSPPCSATLPPTRQPTGSASEELSLILRALHAETGGDFRDAIDSVMDPNDLLSLHKAEENGLLLQAAAIFDQVVRQRLPRRLAELVGWKTPSGLAEVVEPARNLTLGLRVVTLRLFGSRGLDGPVAFRVRQSASEVPDPFPASALLSLGEMLEAGYFKQIAYLEPLFHEGRLLHSQGAVRRFKCRPKDPILAGFLGCGPTAYGYDLRDPTVRNLFEKRRYRDQPPLVVMLIAHWD
jgi:hypothetical protein